MFKKKEKEIENINFKQVNVVDNYVLEPYKQPMVFLFDIKKEVVENLEELRINYYEGSFGSAINVDNNNDQKFLQPNHDYPENLHEFDIVMMDFTNYKSENYDPIRHQWTNPSGSTVHALLSAYPEQIFDPRPLSVHLVSKDLNDLLAKKSVIIAFCGPEIISNYKYIEITGRGANIKKEEKSSNFGFYPSFPRYMPRNGKKVRLPEKSSFLSDLFSKHLDSIEFNTIFHHPTTWNSGHTQKDEEFIPLLVNERNEIVSFAHFVCESIIFVFPDIKDKPSFIAELFKTYLPEITPEIFPFHGEFKWLDGGDYLLPGEHELLLKRSELDNKYNREITENEMQRASLKEKYKFLSDLITETGENLVSAVEAYLTWLGFKSVVNLDDTNPDILEEDIQVDCVDRFLVIEIKGIGGTSTDKDCSQISKIRYRRAEQRGKFDVFGLYIVNHQRYISPNSRSNPPFTDNQLADAILDKRGLLTTYELYKSYFLIEEGILQKEDVRSLLFQPGLVVLEPDNLVAIGIPNELYMDGHVAIVNLKDTILHVGDTLIVKKQGTYSKVIIISLQVDDKGVESCNAGEVGIKLDKGLKKNSELFVKGVAQ